MPGGHMISPCRLMARCINTGPPASTKGPRAMSQQRRLAPMRQGVGQVIVPAVAPAASPYRARGRRPRRRSDCGRRDGATYPEATRQRLRTLSLPASRDRANWGIARFQLIRGGRSKVPGPNRYRRRAVVCAANRLGGPGIGTTLGGRAHGACSRWTARASESCSVPS